METNRTDPAGEGDRRDAGVLQASLVLLRNAQLGDRAALDRLLARYQDRILRVVRLRMGRGLRRHLESGDVLQEVLLTAARTYERFEVREEASLIYWLARIVENEVLRKAEFHRRERRDPQREVPMNESRPAAVSGADPAERREERERPERALESLSARKRELIVQRDYLGASWAAIAEDFGYASPEVARVTHSRAVLELGKILRRGVDRSEGERR